MAALTYKRVSRLKAGEAIADPGCRGLRFIGGPKGVYAQFRYKDPEGWHSMGLGRLPDRDELEALAGEDGRGSYHFDEAIEDFRKQAWEKKRQLHGGIDPREPEKNSLRVIARRYIEREAKKRNRSWEETERIFNVYINPTLGGRAVEAVTRRDVAELLDTIEDGKVKAEGGRMLGGPVMADRTLAALRRVMNWHAARDERFASPIVKGMARTKPGERARDRVLSDDEIRKVWRGSRNGFGALVRALLLTAQRRDEVRLMRWSEIEGDTWTIPKERYKTKRPNAVPLSEPVRRLLALLPRYAGCDWVFTLDGKGAINGVSKGKAALDTAAGVSGWTIHDLRRTARTLMARGGASAEHSERVLGHVIGGVEGVYDKHDYVPEKRDALDKLAREVEGILFPPPKAKPAKAVPVPNVIPLRGRRGRR